MLEILCQQKKGATITHDFGIAIRRVLLTWLPKKCCTYLQFVVNAQNINRTWTMTPRGPKMAHVTPVSNSTKLSSSRHTASLHNHRQSGAISEKQVTVGRSVSPGDHGLLMQTRPPHAGFSNSIRIRSQPFRRSCLWDKMIVAKTCEKINLE